MKRFEGKAAGKVNPGKSNNMSRVMEDGFSWCVYPTKSSHVKRT